MEPAVFFLFGLCVGSFLNVVIYRLPNGKSIVKPRSSCPKCGHMISALENIPILSYLALGGKCKACKQPISPRYPAIELINGALWLLPALLGMKTPAALCAAAFSSLLLAISMIDLDTFIVPNSLVLAIVIISAPMFFFDDRLVWHERLIGFLVGGGTLYIVGYVAAIALQKEGMGGGDIKFMAACGLFLGWKNILFSMFVGAVASLFGVLAMRLFKREMPTRSDLPTEESDEPLEAESPDDPVLPFAPGLAVGVLVCFYWGAQIIHWYVSKAMPAPPQNMMRPIGN
jgi:leader peptidase (prepilin peptidase)/N-methyltransferase